MNSTSASFDQAITQEATKKNKNLKWDKLPKYTQWKLFKAFMHKNEITNGELFKKMKSMISEKRTDAFVTYDVSSQEITDVDFKHEIFIRERSKKKKLQVQLAQSLEEKKIKELENALQGIKVQDENIEIIDEETCILISDSDEV